MITKTTSDPSPRAQANTSPPVIRADELYLWSELVKRLRWKRHSARQAQRLGLKPTRFGSRLYISGAAVMAWFADLQEVTHD
jgi:hypothetical protein